MKTIRPPVPAALGFTNRSSQYFISHILCRHKNSQVSESTLCFLADSTRYGNVAFNVLKDPMTSISITDLNALTDNWLIDARKLPAAPALHQTSVSSSPYQSPHTRTKGNRHDKINLAQLLHTPLHSSQDILEPTHIHRSNTNNLRPGPHGSDLLRSRLGLLDIASDDTRVCAQMHQCAHLSTTYRARTSGTEDHLVS